MSIEVLLNPKSVNASSVWNRDASLNPLNVLKQDDTCWTSGGSSNPSEMPTPYLSMSFTQKVQLSKLRLLYQGGFGAECVTISGKNEGSDETWQVLDTIDTEDQNEWQSHCVQVPPVSHLKLEFSEASDLYGRVTVYQLELFGIEAQ